MEARGSHLKETRLNTRPHDMILIPPLEKAHGKLHFDIKYAYVSTFFATYELGKFGQ